jgi:predicted thioesterase
MRDRVDKADIGHRKGDAGPIGGGMHERFIINTEKFMARTEAKLK